MGSAGSSEMAKFYEITCYHMYKVIIKCVYTVPNCSRFANYIFPAPYG
jgi:hypothetical protein